MHLIFWVGGTAYAQSNNFQNYMKQAILQIKKGQPEQAIKTASIMMGEVPELLKAGNTEAVIRLYKVQIEAYRMTDHDEMANQKMNELKTLITRRGVSEENFNASYKNLLLQ
ncbi:MAG TPA: hypothetical protein PLP34_09545 [Chitinophagaceae bacterium]|nr:hypothetical protein [Chitinophagaceae bacterium]HNF72647.1 hypothetical protein [Chitinophagaceae bacterium]